MKVLHLWDNYAPGLFDQSFEICREEGVEAALVCMNLISDGDEIREVRWVRRTGKRSSRITYSPGSGGEFAASWTKALPEAGPIRV